MYIKNISQNSQQCVDKSIMFVLLSSHNRVVHKKHITHNRESFKMVLTCKEDEK